MFDAQLVEADYLDLKDYYNKRAQIHTDFHLFAITTDAIKYEGYRRSWCQHTVFAGVANTKL